MLLSLLIVFLLTSFSLLMLIVLSTLSISFSPLTSNFISLPLHSTSFPLKW